MVAAAGAVGAEERIYAQVGTLDATSTHQLQHQANQIFYNAQFDIDTMGKVPRKLLYISHDWLKKFKTSVQGVH